MTKENKETNIQPAPAENNEEIRSEASQTTDNQQVQEEQIDYKAELEKAIAENSKKDKQLKQAEYNIEQLKKKPKEDDDWSFDDEKEDVRTIIREEIKQSKIDDMIDNAISTISNNEDEKALIKHHYLNSIKQTGLERENIINDLNNAKALANSSKILKENREVKEALKAKQTISSGSAGSSAGQAVKPEEGYPEDLSDQDIAHLKRRGITPEKYNKLSNR